MNLNLELVKKYFYPQTILDIGAHHGEFHNYCKLFFPSSHIFCIEGNGSCEQALKDINCLYEIILLGKENKKTIFYKQKNDLQSTGNSVYKELTEHFNDDVLIEEERELQTLDQIFNPFISFDLIKIDTQGSELDILEGGKYQAQRAKGILLEVSTKPYNEGAPLYDEIINYMNSIGFEAKETLDGHLNAPQLDILFIKK
jgi:FkbM family methyltransferase